MILYIKAKSSKDIEQIKVNAEELGLKFTNIIVDESSVQKTAGSVYYMVRDQAVEDKILAIDSLSSIGNDNRQIFNEIDWFNKHDIALMVLDCPSTLAEGFDSTKLMGEIFAFLAEKERKNVKSAQAVGIARRMDEHKPYGRKKIPYPDNWEELYFRWEKKEITAVEFMEACNLKKGTFYNLLKQYQKSMKEADNALGLLG